MFQKEGSLIPGTVRPVMAGKDTLSPSPQSMTSCLASSPLQLKCVFTLGHSGVQTPSPGPMLSSHQLAAGSPCFAPSFDHLQEWRTQNNATKTMRQYTIPFLRPLLATSCIVRTSSHQVAFLATLKTSSPFAAAFAFGTPLLLLRRLCFGRLPFLALVCCPGHSLGMKHAGTSHNTPQGNDE